MVKTHMAFKHLSNAAWLSGSLLAAYVLIRVFFFSGGIQAGSCPLILQRPWIVIAIVLLALSFVFSLFEPKKLKNKQDDNPGEPE